MCMPSFCSFDENAVADTSLSTDPTDPATDLTPDPNTEPNTDPTTDPTTGPITEPNALTFPLF
jgi:hypothetical protein